MACLNALYYAFWKKLSIIVQLHQQISQDDPHCRIKFYSNLIPLIMFSDEAMVCLNGKIIEIADRRVWISSRNWYGAYSTPVKR